MSEEEEVGKHVASTLAQPGLFRSHHLAANQGHLANFGATDAPFGGKGPGAMGQDFLA